MPTFTSNYNLSRPLVDDPTDEDLWGGYLNDDLDDLDTLMRQGICNTLSASQTTGFTAVSTISVRNFYRCDASGGAFAATLPTAASSGNGATVAFKKTDSSTNAITITRAGADTIDGATTLAVDGQYDTYVLVSDGVSAWHVLSEPSETVPDASTTTKGIIEIATNAEVETGTDTDKAVVPSSVNSHLGVAKAWVKFAGSNGAVAKSHNISSVTRNSTGDYTVTFTTAFDDTDYIVIPGCSPDAVTGATTQAIATVGAQSTGSCVLYGAVTNASSVRVPVDPIRMYAVFYGTQ